MDGLLCRQSQIYLAEVLIPDIRILFRHIQPFQLNPFLGLEIAPELNPPFLAPLLLQVFQ